MAIFSTGPIIGSISGTAGGATFVNARGSKVVRKKRRVNSLTGAAHILEQARFSNVTKLWSTLTTDEKNAWNTYALSVPKISRVGVSRLLSGYQAFVKNRLFLNGTIGFENNLPPALGSDPITAPIFFTSSVAGGIDVHIGRGPEFGDITIAFYGRLLYTVNKPKSWTSKKLFGTLKVAQDTVTDITTKWQTEFPLPILDQVVVITARPFSTAHVFKGEITNIINTTA